MQESLLMLNRGGFPPFSSRGCFQRLTPLPCGELRRTVNGRLVYTGLSGHQKYSTMIKCQDQVAPALEGLWRGEEIEVSCLQRLSQEMGQEAQVLLERPCVEGSLVATSAQGEMVEIVLENNRLVRLQDASLWSQKIYVSYRPLLHMRVTHFSLETNEWGATVGWALELEEI